MFSKTLLRIAILLLSVNVLFSCKKEPENLVAQNTVSSAQFKNGFAKYSWSEKEAEFFSLNTHKKFQSSGSLESRNDELVDFIYHPDLVGLYNEIAEQNAAHHFVEEIIVKAGLPVWRYARIVEDAETQKSHIVVPLAFDTYPAVTGLITAIKNENGFVINAISRQELLNTDQGDPLRNVAYANALAGYDKILFGIEGEALETFCDYVKILDENPPLGPDPALPPDEDCEWRFLEVCSDDVTQTTWFGGLSNMPPHLDHDGDGIINYEDQDWLQYGISQEEFEHYVEMWWEENYQQEYGYYHDFWNEDLWEDFTSTGGGQDFNEFWDDFSDIWDNLWDWIRSDDNYFGDDIYYDPDPGNPSNCYFDWPREGGAQIEERDIRCYWYYILDCGEEYNTNNWWQVLTHINCPECPGYQEYEKLYYDRIEEYYDTHDQAFSSFTSLDDLIQTAQLIGCDAFSPYFEHCINEALLVSVFGLGYTNIFTEEAIDWLTITPAYPQGPQNVYWIANYWKSEGYSEEAKQTIQLLVNLVGETNPNILGFEHINWLLEQGEFIQELDNFFNTFEGTGNPIEIVSSMLSIFDPNVSESTLIDLIHSLDTFFESPDDEDSIEQLWIFFEDNNLDPFATNSGPITQQPTFDDWEFPDEDNIDWQPLDPNQFWELAGDIKASLRDQYPDQAVKIDEFFPCRVLGIALERMVLESLGVPKNTTTISANGESAIPDGMLSGWVLDGATPFE